MESYDEHTLILRTGCATVEQIRESFRRAVATAESQYKLTCRFKVNRVENREGEGFGYSFVFLSNSQVYYMLLGHNPDGSERIEYHDDPEWVPPETINSAPSNDWAEMMEEEADLICPQITTALPPLLTLPPFRLTPEQKAAKEAEHGEEVEELVPFRISRAMVVNPDPKFSSNVIRCRAVPEWVSTEDIKAQAGLYVSDSTTKHLRTLKGKKIKEAYPWVSISQERVAFVVFDPATKDALFALHMLKKMYIKKGEREVTLIFGNSFRSEDQRTRHSPARTQQRKVVIA